MTLNFSMSKRDKDLLRSLKRSCQIDKKETFTSDDFHMLGLDRFLPDVQHGLGGLFARWKHHNLIEDTGQRQPSMLVSNHLREIKVWRFTSGIGDEG